MLKGISNEKYMAALARENPSWAVEGIHRQAEIDLASFDERLFPAVKAYVEDGRATDYRFGEFSLFLIQGLRRNCGYLQAVSLMDSYMKDMETGKSQILRR